MLGPVHRSRRHNYAQKAIKFQGNTPCIAHILNLVVQDILKGIIKNDYNTSYSKDIYKEEKEEDNNKENQETSKFINT